MERLTLPQRGFLVRASLKNGNNYRRVYKLYSAQFPDTKPPSRSTIYKLQKKFEFENSLEDRPRSGRPRVADDGVSVPKLGEVYDQQPNTSIRHAPPVTDIPTTTAYRLIRKELGLKPFRPRKVQKLNNEDPRKRIEFCHWLQDASAADPTIVDRILWTDGRSNVQHLWDEPSLQ